MSNTMSIADLLKYAEFLEKRGEEISRKMRQLEVVKTTTRVINVGTAQNIEETTAPTMSVDDFASWYDANSKELRLVRQAIERLNHSTVIEFTPAF